MYGWRGIIGTVSPSVGAAVPTYEFYQMAPKGVLQCSIPGTVRELDRENLERQLAKIEEAAIELDELGVDVITIGGGPVFMTQGVGSNIEICASIQQKVKAPVTCVVTAEFEALRTLGASKVVVVTPFEDWLNQTTKSFVEGSGFEVVNIGGLGIKRNAEISRLPEHAAYRLAKKLYLQADTRADAVLIRCPLIPTIEYIELLERELGCPVVTTSQCSLWHCLKLLSIREDIRGYGTLMRTLA